MTGEKKYEAVRLDGIEVLRACRELCGFEGRVYQQKWPEFDPAKCVDSAVEIAVQVSGKLRGRVTIPRDCSNEEALAAAKAVEEVAAAIAGKTIVKEIVVPNKLVNIVAK